MISEMITSSVVRDTNDEIDDVRVIERIDGSYTIQQGFDTIYLTADMVSQLVERMSLDVAA